MIESYRQKKTLPTLVKKESGDDEFTLRIKRIIANMTQFRFVNRKNIKEVEEEYKGSGCFLRSGFCSQIAIFQIDYSHIIHIKLFYIKIHSKFILIFQIYNDVHCNDFVL